MKQDRKKKNNNANIILNTVARDFVRVKCPIQNLIPHLKLHLGAVLKKMSHKSFIIRIVVYLYQVSLCKFKEYYFSYQRFYLLSPVSGKILANPYLLPTTTFSPFRIQSLIGV